MEQIIFVNRLSTIAQKMFTFRVLGGVTFATFIGVLLSICVVYTIVNFFNK